jgi:acetyl-CoA carboxylase biotin carboxyl carrier protein
MSKQTITINSPLSGVFYRRSSPEEPSFVEIGDKVTDGTVVCIVESMKIFNDIRVEQEGIISKILLEDESPVMKDQAMFEIEVG